MEAEGQGCYSYEKYPFSWYAHWYPLKSPINSQFWACFENSLITKISTAPHLATQIDLPGVQINDPLSGKDYSIPFLPATPLSPSWTLEGLFELTRRPSRALDSPRALLPELQRNKDTVRCAALGAEVQGHHQEQLTQTLIVRLLKTHFLSLF